MMLKVGIIGISGRMGHMLFDACGAEGIKVVCGVCQKDETPLPMGYAGEVAEKVTDLKTLPDLFIDFSRPECTVEVAKYAASRGIAMVIGTTGFKAEQNEAVREAARQIPVVMAANFSVGVNVMLALIKKAASVMPDVDLEIVEAHHRYKVDAPSGTALAMGEAAAQGRHVSLNDVKLEGRSGITGERTFGTIGFSSVRGGDIVGEHKAMFCGEGERVELGHIATSRMTFARGAVRAATWLQGKKAGLYSFNDVLGLNKI